MNSVSDPNRLYYLPIPFLGFWPKQKITINQFIVCSEQRSLFTQSLLQKGDTFYSGFVPNRGHHLLIQDLCSKKKILFTNNNSGSLVSNSNSNNQFLSISDARKFGCMYNLGIREGGVMYIYLSQKPRMPERGKS